MNEDILKGKRKEIKGRGNGKLGNYPTVLAVAAAVLLGFIVLASASPSLAASPEPGLATAGKPTKTDRVEARIKELHAKLKITSAQEALWDNVTQVMRDNAKTMEALINARTEKESTMNAVDDLKSYGRNCRGACGWYQEIHPRLRASLCQHVGRSEEGCRYVIPPSRPKKAKAKAKAKGK